MAFAFDDGDDDDDAFSYQSAVFFDFVDDCMTTKTDIV